MKIRINDDRKNVFFSGVRLEPGESYEVPDDFGRQLVKGNRATDANPVNRDRIPADFPGAKALERIGMTSLRDLRGVADFSELPGIGKKTAEKIAEALRG